MTTHNDEVQQEAAQGPDEETVRQALRKVKDPEAGINIIDLGLVYDIAVADDSKVTVTMTLTSPAVVARRPTRRRCH